MQHGLVILLSLVSSVGLFLHFDVVSFLGYVFAPRLMILMAVAPALLLAAYQLRQRYQLLRVETCSDRVKAKWVALVIMLLALLLYAFAMSEAGIRPFPTFVADYFLAFPVLIVFAWGYVRWADRRLPEPADGYFLFGSFVLGWRAWHFEEQKPFLLSWGVKILFIPIMYGALVGVASRFLALELALTPGSVVLWLFLFGLCFDLVIATSGYLFSSYFFGNQVYSTDDNWRGWLVCLICYPPLVFGIQRLRDLGSQIRWHDWLVPNEPLYWLWALLVTGTWGVYWYAKASFGLRFSNLSWRGLVDTGPYRWTKHPSYLFKNIYWWAHAVPFVGVFSTIELVRNISVLALISLIYFLRAKTEEMHLMRFPEYRGYAERIGKAGLVARLAGRRQIVMSNERGS